MKVQTAPTNITKIDTMNGRYQLCVLSMIMPATIGEAMAASAEPEFIMPAAVPANFGAISIGIDQIGPMHISAKKKPDERQIETTVML